MSEPTPGADGWEVSVYRHGARILTLGHNHQAGVTLCPEDEAAIRTAAQHLTSFIGDPAAPGADGTKAPQGHEREEISTFTPLLWISMNGDERYAELIWLRERVNTLIDELASPSPEAAEIERLTAKLAEVKEERDKEIFECRGYVQKLMEREETLVALDQERYTWKARAESAERQLQQRAPEAVSVPQDDTTKP